jgi:hypothetical protein
MSHELCPLLTSEQRASARNTFDDTAKITTAAKTKTMTIRSVIFIMTSLPSNLKSGFSEFLDQFHDLVDLFLFLDLGFPL